MLSRRRFIATTPLLVGGAMALPGCGSAGSDRYDALAESTWRPGMLRGASGPALARELVRYATLAPSSHNTQCWSFTHTDSTITIRPDASRRCPAVDPDDHHLFVSLGCATENLVQAALAHGYRGEVSVDPARTHVRVTLEPTAPQRTPLFSAITERQCTRGDYDARPIAPAELDLLQRAGAMDGVRLLLITERRAMERVLDHVVQANTAQMADTAFVAELKHWIRFNGAAAVASRDGLYTGCTGSPTIPTWIGELAFGLFFTAKDENEKIVRQFRSSSGVAVFVGASADPAQWVDVGRCYERFALQATALGIRNTMLNQPVEVAALRPDFAASVGVAGVRPDLLVRFGRGPAMPRSLRRPVTSVLA